MTTALALITRSMRLATVLQKGESLDNDEAQDGLISLNSMLDSWRIQRLFVYQILDEAFTLTVGDSSYTVGTSGDFNTSRPAKLENSCFVRINSIDSGLEIINEQQYAAISDKTSSGLPFLVYYDNAYPTATINFYYVPDQAYSFHMKSWRTLQSFSNLTTDLALPPGYERAICYSLADEFGVEFGVQVPPKVSAIGLSARKAIKNVNAPALVLNTEVARQYPYNVRAG